MENQEQLTQKKKAYGQLARQINGIKSDIDGAKEKLEQLKADRESEGIVVIVTWLVAEYDVRMTQSWTGYVL